MIRDTSIETTVTVGITGQLVHTVYQILVFAIVGDVAWLVLAVAGIVAALAGAAWTVRAGRATTRELERDRERLGAALRDAGPTAGIAVRTIRDRRVARRARRRRDAFYQRAVACQAQSGDSEIGLCPPPEVFIERAVQRRP